MVGTYQLAPYEKISEEEYHEMKSKMKPFEPSLLQQYEQSETTADLDNMESCESGVCPIR
jgi:ribonucleoside-triphosphate reductase